MGLDVAFNREQALRAGLTLKIERLGTDEQIERAKQDIADGNEDPDYLDFLTKIETLVKVPNADHYTDDGGTDTDIIVRANKWGYTYAPLTEWLASKGIEWSEF